MKSENLKLSAMAGLAFLALFVTPTHAAEKATVKTGYLTCDEPVMGFDPRFITRSSLQVHVNKHRTEYYTGSVSKFGTDIGYLRSAVILWAVAAPTTDLGPGALAGDYAGAQASVALGVGAGANVLLGGFHKSIALQPV
jgi:uncharacterized protein DUF992